MYSVVSSLKPAQTRTRTSGIRGRRIHMPSHYIKYLATVDLSKVDVWEAAVLHGEFKLRCEGRFATFILDGEFPRGEQPYDAPEIALEQIFERNALSLTVLFDWWSNWTFDDDEGWRFEYEAWWKGACEAKERADIPLGNRRSEHSYIERQ